MRSLLLVAVTITQESMRGRRKTVSKTVPSDPDHRALSRLRHLFATPNIHDLVVSSFHVPLTRLESQHAIQLTMTSRRLYEAPEEDNFDTNVQRCTADNRTVTHILHYIQQCSDLRSDESMLDNFVNLMDGQKMDRAIECFRRLRILGELLFVNEERPLEGTEDTIQRLKDLISGYILRGMNDIASHPPFHQFTCMLEHINPWIMKDIKSTSMKRWHDGLARTLEKKNLEERENVLKPIFLTETQVVEWVDSFVSRWRDALTEEVKQIVNRSGVSRRLSHQLTKCAESVVREHIMDVLTTSRRVLTERLHHSNGKSYVIQDPGDSD
ncbi:hypothetical protein PROFUN_10228 [Planoprotostelium fungivorum]|uniref:Uncharacterized protein n=1 Tax=Planoprotostelium fungivorum TaxID=1890364 RepID=A0A2P6NED7_9EUKA|nr:hypothetical protein PROFUN_10228 [Planoprotostelium fungivorum]